MSTTLDAGEDRLIVDAFDRACAAYPRAYGGDAIVDGVAAGSDDSDDALLGGAARCVRRFHAASAAEEVLSDDAKRIEYDVELARIEFERNARRHHRAYGGGGLLPDWFRPGLLVYYVVVACVGLVCWTYALAPVLRGAQRAVAPKEVEHEEAVFHARGCDHVAPGAPAEAHSLGAEDSRANLEERPLPVLRRAPHSNCNRLRGTRGHHRLCRLAHLVLALHTRSRRLGLLDVGEIEAEAGARARTCLLYTSPSPRDRTRSRMPSSA